MHLLARPGDPFVPLAFNVDSSVGEGGANSNSTDVALVQFLLKKTSRSPKLSADTKARMARVRITGSVDPLTVDGIRAIQEHMRRKHPGTVVDGRVSPARGHWYGEGAWTIVSLNRSMRIQFPSQWPRLQDISECPGSVRSKVPTLI